MKNLKITIQSLALILFVVLSSCSKKDYAPIPTPVVYQEENFYDGYLTASGFNEKTRNLINGSDNECGIEFAPTVKGKITALVVKIPDSRSDLKITIWDKSAGTAMRTETVNVAVANTEYTIDIIDMELIKDKEYIISMNSNDRYIREKNNESQANYPIIIGNIKINNFSNKIISVPTFPTIANLDFVAGDVSFKFLRTE